LRTGKLLIERRYFRGGGAYAFHVLRKDTDQDRLKRCRYGFETLYSGETKSPLDKLASVLLGAGTVDTSPRKDEIEQTSRLRGDDLEDLYRNGIVSILEHTELSSVSRVKALINWTAFWLVHLQHCRSAEFLGKKRGFIICDCGAGRPQLRRASQRCLKDMQALILEAVDKAVADKPAQMSKQQRNKIRSFFWATAASIKMLNAWTGRRHFTLGLSILETLVLASTQPRSEISFETFVDDWLFGKYNLVTGKRSAEKSGLLSVFDASVFEDNEASLAMHMQAAGLLTQYSDATRMVSAGVV
jgi:hypothetical protein